MLPWRARREGLWVWVAEVLHRNDAGDVWFKVGERRTKGGARKLAQEFAAEMEAQA